ncbi:hemagglutinin repeat-containing protein [Psychrobacter vallis]|uniref:hemagglutinin repeat-containing protein n=1 Tax=Psychrobacter vallis TaxID=248451 RepID=UPI001917D542|nr:hemagglutinin repeat-containing protein [Psychrobacter vallis]
MILKRSWLFLYLYTNSQINVGGTTTFDIGRDVNIKGGVINTGRAQGVIGGDVTIESLQDTATYDSKQKNMGFNADIDIAGGGAGSSLSVNGVKTNLNADYKAVGEQSGIFTGDGGLDLTAKGKTTLIGGAITTTDAALQAGLNNYVSKGGIETQDIRNTTSYEGDAIQVGVSVGNTNNKPQASMNGLGYGTDSDSDSSVTRAGITGIAGNKDITTDNRAEYAGILENSFDAGRVNEELGAQTQITHEFGKEAPKAVGDYASKREETLILNGNVEEAKKWGDGGAYRVALHTLVGAIATGSVEGALSSGTTAVSIPAVRRYLDKQGVDETTRGALLLGLSAAAGAVVGGNAASNATSFSQTQNNYLTHIQEAARAKELSACKTNECRRAVLVKYIDIDKEQNEEFNAAYDGCRNANAEACKTFRYLHVTQRGSLNAKASQKLLDDLKSGNLNNNWDQLSDDKNIFHNFDSNGKPKKLPNGQYQYKKFVSKDGRFEVIIDSGKDGSLSRSEFRASSIVTDPTNAGTYN